MNMTTTATITTTLGTDDGQHEGNNKCGAREVPRARARALRKSAVADATRQRLPRACRSILAPQVEGFSRNHSATYVFHGFSSSQPPRPSAALGGYGGVTPVFLRPSFPPLPASCRCEFFVGKLEELFQPLLHCFLSLVQNMFIALCHGELSSPNMIHLGNFAVASRNLSCDSRYSSFVKC